MKRKDAIEFVKKSKSKFFTYGQEGSDLGTPVSKTDTIKDIENMTDDTWANGDVFETDKEGKMLENVIVIREEVTIKQENYKIVLEKGDKVQVLKEVRADANAVSILLKRGLKAYFDNRFDGEIGYYDPESYTTDEIGDCFVQDIALALVEISSNIKKRELEDNYNYRDWVNEILSSVAYGLKNGNYNV